MRRLTAMIKLNWHIYCMRFEFRTHFVLFLLSVHSETVDSSFGVD